jgi:hypothetical protein
MDLLTFGVSLSGAKRLKEPMLPAYDQKQLAGYHGLQAQLEAMDYMEENWVLADMDRQAIRRLQAQRGEGPPPNVLQAAMAGWGPGNLEILPRSKCRKRGCFYLIALEEDS